MKLKNIDVFAKYYAMQILLGWLTIDQVPKILRERTQYFVDLSAESDS